MALRSVKTSHATTNMAICISAEISVYCNTHFYNIEITSSCFTYANYATTAMHNETSCDAQVHNFYNTL